MLDFPYNYNISKPLNLFTWYYLIINIYIKCFSCKYIIFYVYGRCSYSILTYFNSLDISFVRTFKFYVELCEKLFKLYVKPTLMIWEFDCLY